MSLAPIVLFVYNRPIHTKKTLKALSNNFLAKDSTLYIFCDGPKSNASDEVLLNIKKTREVIREKKWCKEVHFIEKEKNYGVDVLEPIGISYVLSIHDKIIVLEDDLETSPYFLSFINEGLNNYIDNKNIISINGYMFPINFENNNTCFISPLGICAWGWGTWRDRWNLFRTPTPKEVSMIEETPYYLQQFNMLKNVNYLDMLKKRKTWDICWYFTSFINSMVGVYPTKTLINNIGFDGTGTHYTANNDSNSFPTQVFEQQKITFPKSSEIDLKSHALLLKYFEEKSKIKKSILRRIHDYYTKAIK